MLTHFPFCESFGSVVMYFIDKNNKLSKRSCVVFSFLVFDELMVWLFTPLSASVCLGSGGHTAASSSVAVLMGCIFWLGSNKLGYTTAGGRGGGCWCGWWVSSYGGLRVPSVMSWLAMNVSITPDLELLCFCLWASTPGHTAHPGRPQSATVLVAIRPSSCHTCKIPVSGDSQ